MEGKWWGRGGCRDGGEEERYEGMDGGRGGGGYRGMERGGEGRTRIRRWMVVEKGEGEKRDGRGGGGEERDERMERMW